MVDIMQVVTIIVNIYVSLTERKQRIYVATFMLNLAQLIMYFLNQDITTGLIYIIIVVRSFIYIYKDNFKTDLIPYSMILLQVVVGVLTMEKDIQFMSILIPCYSCWYLWFYNDTQKLRVGNIIANILWAIYNACTGLYIILIMRFMTIMSNLVGYIKRSYELRKIEGVN